MKKFSFLEELLILDSIEVHCSGLDLKDGSKRYGFPLTEKTTLPETHGRSYWDVPDYMKVSFLGAGKLSEKNVALYEGSYIDLGQYKDLDHFLTSKLSSGRISKIRANKRKLEQVFPIRYAHFHGEIPEDTYGHLMEALKKMITHRFEEKKMDHMALADWDNFLDRGKKLIDNGRAAMAVIYHGELPIHISFNYVWEDMVFGFVRGYDLDYSKFYLGFTDILIQLQWCFDHGFRIYDLLRGNLEYKLMLADRSYLYRIHFLIPRENWHKNLLPLAQWWAAILKFDVYYPLLDKLKAIYHKLPFMPKRRKKRPPVYQFLEPTSLESRQVRENTMGRTSLEDPDQKYLKRAAYHFLYNGKTPLPELQVHKMSGSGTYFFQAGDKIVKVLFPEQENNS